MHQHLLRVRIHAPGERRDWTVPGGAISRSERAISERTVAGAGAEVAAATAGAGEDSSTLTQQAKTKRGGDGEEGEAGASAYRTPLSENGGNITMQSFGRNVSTTVPRQHSGGRYGEGGVDCMQGTTRRRF